MSSTPHYYLYYIIIEVTLVLYKMCNTRVEVGRGHKRHTTAADVLRNTHISAVATHNTTCRLKRSPAFNVCPPAGPLAVITTQPLLVYTCA